jgi:hypothetical protein
VTVTERDLPIALGRVSTYLIRAGMNNRIGDVVLGHMTTTISLVSK